MCQKHPLNQQAASTHTVSVWPSAEVSHNFSPNSASGFIPGGLRSLVILLFLSTDYASTRPLHLNHFTQFNSCFLRKISPPTLFPLSLFGGEKWWGASKETEFPIPAPSVAKELIKGTDSVSPKAATPALCGSENAGFGGAQVTERSAHCHLGSVYAAHLLQL